MEYPLGANRASGACKPTHQAWDPKPGAEAPRVNCGFSKAPERHRRGFFCVLVLRSGDHPTPGAGKSLPTRLRRLDRQGKPGFAQAARRTSFREVRHRGKISRVESVRE